MKWCLIIALIYIPLVTNDVDNAFKCLLAFVYLHWIYVYSNPITTSFFSSARNQTRGLAHAMQML